MVSDPSALLLLKYGIPCHKNFEKLHLQNNLGHKLVRERGRGRGVLFKLLMLMFYFLLR